MVESIADCLTMHVRLGMSGNILDVVATADETVEALRLRLHVMMGLWDSTEELVMLSGSELLVDSHKIGEITNLQDVQALVSRWTRLCHSTEHESMVWDMPLQDAQAVAQHCSQVRIQVKGADLHVTSKPNTCPIEDVRNGRPIGFMRELTEEDVGSEWEESQPDLLRFLCHANCTPELLEELWRCDGGVGDAPDFSSLEQTVYHAAAHNGLHWWHRPNHPIQMMSSWTFCGDEVELELYVK